MWDGCVKSVTEYKNKIAVRLIGCEGLLLVINQFGEHSGGALFVRFPILESNKNKKKNRA